LGLVCEKEKETVNHCFFALFQASRRISDIKFFIIIMQASLLNWASTLTSNGRNMPFVLPLRTDAVDDGCRIGLLRVTDDGVKSAATIEATVESVEGVVSSSVASNRARLVRTHDNAMLEGASKAEECAHCHCLTSFHPCLFVLQGNVLFIRLYEGPASYLVLSERIRAAPDAERLKTLLNACPDVNTIMNTMKEAIVNAVVQARATST
jgi:hypothetical protein